MSNKLRSFLEGNFGNTSDEVLNQFVDGLKNSSGTAEGLHKITAKVFEVVSSRMESESDRMAVEWLRKLVEAMHREAYQPVPKVREALFFPDERSEHRLIHWLGEAKHELLVCVFTITNNNLRNALKDAHRRGVHVRIISDDECMKQQGSDVQALCDFGIPTEIDTNPHAHMHNKFVVIDKSIIITGSFNWTVSAVNANQENLMVVSDEVLSIKYIDYFNDLWGQFRPVEAHQYPSHGSHRHRH